MDTSTTPAKAPMAVCSRGVTVLIARLLRRWLMDLGT